MMASAAGTPLGEAVSNTELFRRLAPESAHKTTYRIQGVDSDFFDPAVQLRVFIKSLSICNTLEYC